MQKHRKHKPSPRRNHPKGNSSPSNRTSNRYLIAGPKMAIVQFLIFAPPKNGLPGAQVPREAQGWQGGEGLVWILDAPVLSPRNTFELLDGQDRVVLAEVFVEAIVVVDAVRRIPRQCWLGRLPQHPAI